MPARKRAENRLKLPRASVGRADEVRAQLAQLGIDKRDVADAVRWVREIGEPSDRRTSKVLRAE